VIKKTKIWRFLEVVPGALVWSMLLLPIVFSFIWPSAVAIYILVFDLYWLFRALVFAYYLGKTYRKMHAALRTDYRRVLEGLPKDDPVISNWKEVYHTVIFATFREEIETLLPSVQSVIEADWPQGRKIIILAGEERDHDRLHRIGNFLREKYKNRLYDFLICEHPDGIAGEVRGKGAGAAWAGAELSKYARQENLDEEKIIVHIADADTRFHRHFFNCVAHEFVINPNRHRRSYQPIPLYSNNIWHVPAVSRLSAWGSSFWQMIEASRPWRLMTFSTHAYSLKMLREMEYWDVTVVNEDSRQFWRAYFAFGGDQKAVPIYLPVHLDAVLGEDYWTTMKNQYLQKRRWAYGPMEHFPYVILESIKHKEIPFFDKTVKIWRMLEGALTWSTASFYLMFVGWLPQIFSETYSHTVLAYNFPVFARAILSVAWLGLIVSAYVSLSFLPPRPRKIKKHKYLEMIAEWVITPISAVLFGSLPALEAQTRMMLGSYLTFWVTPKKQAK